MYIGKLEPIAKYKASERKYKKRYTEHSESKTVNQPKTTPMHNYTHTNNQASQTLFNASLLSADSS